MRFPARSPRPRVSGNPASMVSGLIVPLWVTALFLSGLAFVAILGRLLAGLLLPANALAEGSDSVPRGISRRWLVLSVAGIMCLAAGFAALTVAVTGQDPALPFDLAINRLFAPLRAPPLLGVLLWITAIGTGPALTAVFIVASALLLADGRRAILLPFWITFLGAQITTWSLKYLIARHRPQFIPGVSEGSPSFPSGHATASLALYGFIAYALVESLPTRRLRLEAAYWTSVLILLIGFSRVFLSLHYATDIIGGYLVGAFWLLIGTSVVQLRPTRPRPSPCEGQRNGPHLAKIARSDHGTVRLSQRETRQPEDQR